MNVNIHFAGWHWHCLGGYHRHLTGTDAPSWNNLAEDPRCRLVKANPIRTVYHLDFRGEQFYIKTYRPNGIIGCLKWLIRGVPSRGEFALLQTARRCQAPAPIPIAWAVKKSFFHPQALLITQSLGIVISLEDLIWSDQKVTSDQIPPITRAVGRLLARLHCSGIIHHDLHAGNILITHDVNNRYDAFITDLQGVKIESRSGHASADPRRGNRMSNLALLIAALRHELEEADIKALIRWYLAEIQPKRKWGESVFEDFFAKICSFAEKHDRRIIKSRERRCLRNSRYARHIKLDCEWSAHVFLQHRHPKMDWLATRHKFTPEQWRQTLSDIPALLEGGELLKQGSYNRIISKELQVGPNHLAVVIKHIKLRKGWRGILQAIRDSRAKRQWHRSFMMLFRDLPTAWPLAVIERHKAGFLRESIFISEKITHSYNLKLALLNNGPLPKTPKNRYELCRELGRLLALLRRSGLKHRDCKASNILLQIRTVDGKTSWKPFLVDLDGLGYDYLPFQQRRHQAIVRLAASVLEMPTVRKTDLIAVFDSYLRHQDLPEATDRRRRYILWKQLRCLVLKQFEKTQKKYSLPSAP